MISIVNYALKKEMNVKNVFLVIEKFIPKQNNVFLYVHRTV